MSKKLVIVESPVKAKTIAKYLDHQYEIISCNGHIRDLPKKELGIDIENGFKATYVINPDKKSTISDIKKHAATAPFIYLASDADREGEAIAWHLKEALKLKDDQFQRIVFRSITKKAILEALKNARNINECLVQTQQARRILDRLVGYQLSPILWKKVKGGLSAGRVQSVAVKLIVERERVIYNFVAHSEFKVTGTFDLGSGSILKAELPKKIADYTAAKKFLEDCQSANFQVADLKKTVGKRKPSAPFTTSTLQQTASQQLGFSVKRTMTIAQRLYEEGHITYMRTDSVHLVDEAMQAIQQVIEGHYGADYYTKRSYQTKSANAQEAHEAIRPTKMEANVVTQDESAQKLYRLIRQRTLASQMAEALLDKTTASINISTREEKLVAKGEIMKFLGFLAVYQEEGKVEVGAKLPKIAVGQVLTPSFLQARETFTKPAARYTEASLVKKLEELGIGRPSTYGPIIHTIQQRGYVERTSREGKDRNYQLIVLDKQGVSEKVEKEIVGAEKNKLFPTSVGMVVNDFLQTHCQQIMNYQFTANTEEEFDKIAQGDLSSEAMLTTFYKEFVPQMSQASEAEQGAHALSRVLGEDPATGKPVIARLSKRYGPLVQIGGLDDEEKPTFASLREGQLLEQLTLEDALVLFQLPREVGIFEENPITAHIGRYGPYVKHDGKFFSLNKDYDPYTITEAEAISVIEKKRSQTVGPLKTFEEDAGITVQDGRYGPYIKTPDRNIKIPKDIVPTSITWEECQRIIKEAPPKGKRRRFAKKKK